ncbi:MAG TPA: hypothetical protein VFS35_10000, partial [Terrimicrobiaceae bacterium]|nr:hypothetical protein [Terrimicrobiaceae bacterium]
GRVDRISGPRISFPDAGDYNTTRWRLPVHEWASHRALVPQDGLYRFVGTGTSSLDFLLQGFTLFHDSPAVLVCVTGAISKRADKIGPFFAGTGIAQRLQMPVVCVGDPSLTRSRDLSLAWYAGCDDHPELPQEIARQLDAVAAATGRPLVLLGTSGGGFAGLSLLPYLGSPATAIACNPQTIIHRYFPPNVFRYIERAFPVIARRHRLEDPLKTTAEQLRGALFAAGVREDLTLAPFPSHARLLILQNGDDAHHLDRHLRPFMEAVKAQWMGPHRALAGPNVAACVGHWGSGHVAPPAEVLEPAVKKIARGESPESVSLNLAAAFKTQSTAAASGDTWREEGPA